MTTLKQITESGAYPSDRIFHICGFPWAATNSPRLKAFLDANSADAVTLKGKLFGKMGSNTDIEILCTLKNDAGSQTVNYAEDKGLNVGGWNVTLLSGPAGSTWDNNSDLQGWGIIGLDWQPVETTQGAARTVLSADIAPTTPSNPTATAVITWPVNKDFGIYDWLDDNHNGSAYTADCYMYCSTGVFLPSTTSLPVSDGTNYTLAVSTAMYNSPNEYIFASQGSQNIILTNYPQSINGMTANLFSVLMNDDGLISGTQPFLERTGKVKPGSTDNGAGEWRLSISGFTEQLKIKTRHNRFEGHLKGYYFNTKASPEKYVNYQDTQWSHVPHMIVKAYDGTTTTRKSVNLAVDPNGYVSFDTIDEILSAAAAVLNGAGLGLTFNVEYDDLRFSGPAGSTCSMSGPIPFICGIGYVDAFKLKNYIDGTLNPFNPSFNDIHAFNSMDLYSDDLDTGPVRVSLAESGDPDVLSRGVEGTSIRNKCTFAYFYQFDLSLLDDAEQLNNAGWAKIAGTEKPIPSEGGAIKKLYYTTTSNVPLGVGDKLSLGQVINGEFQTAGDISVVSTEADGTKSLQLEGNKLAGMPWVLYWPNGLQEALQTNTEYQQVLESALTTINGLSTISIEDGQDVLTPVVEGGPSVVSDLTGKHIMTDPFMLRDSSLVTTSNGVDIFRQLLGDPDTDVGMPKSMIQTAINDIFPRGSTNCLELINFSKLEEIVNRSKLKGFAKYVLSTDSGDSGNTSALIDFDVLSMMQGFALTHGAKMVWEYNEGRRSYRLTFIDADGQTEAQAVTGGRVIPEGATITKTQPGTIGGGWYYGSLKAQYKRTASSKVIFNMTPRDARIQHSLGSKAIEIKDKITVLPTDVTQVRDELAARFSKYLQLWQNIQYKHSLSVTLSAYTKIMVGGGHIINSAPIPDRTTGRRNVGDLLCEVQSATFKLGNEPGVDIQVLTEPLERKGISGSLYASNGTLDSGTTYDFTGAALEDAHNDFADPNGGLTDLSTFGCYDYIDGSIVARDCSCGDYEITIFERNATRLYYDAAGVYANQNVWKGTIKNIDTDLGTFSVTLDDDNNFSPTGDFVVIYAERDRAGIQPCQTAYYGWLGDAHGNVTNSAGDTSSAILVR